MSDEVLTLPISLPYGLIFVKDIISSNIIENLRYSTSQNFTNRPVAGYPATCNAILTVSAVEALNTAVNQLKADGYSLVIYDAYRPQKAVDQFVQWSENTNDQEAKDKYYPHVNKQDLFNLGYLSKKSGHSRGSTLDVTIILLSNTLKPIQPVERELGDGRKVLWLDDGTIDMGTGFDLFDEASHHGSDLVEEGHKKMRNYFKGVMEAAGFVANPKEWWHYTFKNEPFADLYYDFDLQSAYMEQEQKIDE
uniref:D-Ala-D-Ala dipeptidase n=1 Tax=Ditylenchus dipsaci TaxID=166011 RepID=A0A915ESH0_9BILA